MRDTSVSVIAYEQMKNRILSGDYPAGAYLKITSLCEELNASTTPIREGLIRLASEGLALEIHGQGYFVPRLTECDYGDLYELNLALAIAALRKMDGTVALAPGELLPEPTPTGMPAPTTAPTATQAPGASTGETLPPSAGSAILRTTRGTEALFLTLAGTTQNMQFVAAQQNVNDRLHLIRRHEPLIFADMEDELQRLWTLAQAQNVADLEQKLVLYHQRRMDNIRLLVRSLRR